MKKKQPTLSQFLSRVNGERFFDHAELLQWYSESEIKAAVCWGMLHKVEGVPTYINRQKEQSR
jgi:hypothetical protein